MADEPGPSTNRLSDSKRRRLELNVVQEALGEGEAMLAENLIESAAAGVAGGSGPTSPRGTGRDDAAAQDSVMANPDLLKVVFGSLSIEDLARAASACQCWRAVAESSDFWQCVDLDGRAVLPHQLLAIARRHPYILKLGLKGTTVADTCFAAVAQTLTRLESLELGRGHVNDSYFGVIAAHAPTLRELIVTKAVLGGSSPAEVVIEHEWLRNVEIKQSRASRLVVKCPRAFSLSLRYSHLAGFVLQCPRLQELDLRGCQKLADASLRVAITRLTSLTSLDLAGNHPLTDETLREIASACPLLTSLDASNCGALTLNSVRGFDALRTLDLSYCDSLTPTTAVPSLESFQALEHLCLDSCGLLTSLNLSLPRLRHLSVANCRSLAGVEARCPALERLSFGSSSLQRSGCGSLKTVLVASDAMQAIAWNGFSSLERVVLACPNLEEFELSDCDALASEVFDSLGDGAERLRGFTGLVAPGCPKLRSVRMLSCDSLQSCSLTSSSLQRLSLVACKGLGTLRLACPSLTCLQLDECDGLEVAVLHDAALQRLALGTCPHLEELQVSGPGLRELDLKGCGMLQRLQLDCPNLRSIDATFCTQLGDDVLERALAGRPPLEELTLSVCAGVSTEGLARLGPLAGLRLLDLSYTEVQVLDGVLGTCPNLESLNLANCRSLAPGALAALEQRQQLHEGSVAPSSAQGEALGSASALGGGGGPSGALGRLRELDVSYCPLPSEEMQRVLSRGSALEVLAVNGCPGVDDALWVCVHPPTAAAMADGGAGGSGQLQRPPHRLRSLSCVGCKKLRVCHIGLVRGGAAASSSGGGGSEWVEAPTLLSGLHILRLGLSGVTELALSLPELESLDVSGCADLASLDLRCPRVLRACFQACRGLPPRAWQPLLTGCPMLRWLDVQHSSAPDSALDVAKGGACPDLATLFTTPQPQPYELDCCLLTPMPVQAPSARLLGDAADAATGEAAGGSDDELLPADAHNRAGAMLAQLLGQ